VCRLPATFGFACPQTSKTALPGGGAGSSGGGACQPLLRLPFCAMPRLDSRLPHLDARTPRGRRNGDAEGRRGDAEDEEDVPCRAGTRLRRAKAVDNNRGAKEMVPPLLLPRAKKEKQFGANLSPTPAATAAARVLFGASRAAAAAVSAAVPAATEASVRPAAVALHAGETTTALPDPLSLPPPRLRKGDKLFGGFFFSR